MGGSVLLTEVFEVTASIMLAVWLFLLESVWICKQYWSAIGMYLKVVVFPLLYGHLDPASHVRILCGSNLPGAWEYCSARILASRLLLSTALSGTDFVATS